MILLTILLLQVMLEVCAETCTTIHIDDCQSRWEGQGDTRVWAIIPGSCVRRPQQRCEQPSLQCRHLPSRRCRTVRRCRRQQCRKVPWTFCHKRPRKQNCRLIQRTLPKEVSRTVKIKNCSL